MCQKHVANAVKKLNGSSLRSSGISVLSAIKNVIRHSVRPSREKNSTPTEVYSKMETPNGFIRPDTESRTQSEYRILRRVVTLVNATQKALTHWKNGRNYAEKVTGSVSIAENIRNSLKTISSLSQWAVQITLLTFNLFVVLAIVANGKSSNIYENPDLLSQDTK